MSVLVIEISVMLWKFSSNMVLMLKQRILWRLCFEKSTSTELRNSDKSTCVWSNDRNINWWCPLLRLFERRLLKYRRILITTKSEVAKCLQKFLKEVKTAGHVTDVLLSDGGKEFNCEAVQKVLEEYGFTHRLAMPDSRTEQYSRARKSYNCGKRSLYVSR